MPVGVTREHSIMGGFGNPKALSNFVNAGLGRFPDHGRRTMSRSNGYDELILLMFWACRQVSAIY